MIDNESKLTKWTIAICFVLIAMYFATPTRADDLDWSDFGNYTTGELLNKFLQRNDMDQTNKVIDLWIDGWFDSMYSFYSYDGVLDSESLSALYACTRKRWPTPGDARRTLLEWGASQELKDVSVSMSLYFGMRLACTSVLGEVVTSEEKERTSS